MKNETITTRLSRQFVTAFCVAAIGCPQSLLACMGSAGPVCTINPAACLKSMVLTKSVPGPVFPIPAAGSGTLAVSNNLFIICPITNNCGSTCTNVGVPVAASLTVTLSPPLPPACPAGSPTLSATISTAAGTMALPVCSPAGTFNPYLVAVTIPGGTCPGLYTVVGTATVTFSDGMVLTQTGDTVICLVNEAPGRPGVPRLNVELITPSFPHMAPGDQHVAMYRVINNDLSNSVTLTAFATSKQAAVRPQGGNEAQGVFAISSPFGDDFPIMFDPGAGCIPLPDHPYTQPTISSPLPVLGPGQTNIVSVGIRSYGQCASGSCSESTLRVEGTFSDGSPALGCASMAFFADTSVPSQSCALQVNDCNHNGIPDALDISSRNSQDQNFNAMPDECEEPPINVPFFSSVSPNNPLPGTPIEVQVAFNEAFPLSNVWANASSLARTQSFGSPLWIGTIPADTRPGPQTVYFLGKDSRGALTSYIALYNVPQPPDPTPPTVISATSSNEQQIAVTFSEALNPGSVGPSNFSVNNGINIIQFVTLSSDGATAFLHLSPGSPVSGDFLIVINGVTDLAGNPILPNSAITGQVIAPPRITVNPPNLFLTGGADATVIVIASGTQPLSYQWRFAGENLVGETNLFLTLNDIRTGDAGPYDVVVSNSSGMATSQVAMVSVTLGPLAVQISRSGSNFVLGWTGGEAPFTVEMTPGLSNPAWEELVTSVARNATLPPNLTSQMFYRVVMKPVPQDPTDYDADRPLVASRYASDTPQYWVQYGVPPLSRLADQLEYLQDDPLAAFAGVQAGFTEGPFLSALERGQLPPEFAQRVQSFLTLGQATWTALVNTYRTFVRESDAVRAANGPNDPRITQILLLFAQVFPHAFNVVQLNVLAPQPTKQFDPPPPANGPNQVDIHGSDAFCLDLNAKPARDDSDTAVTNEWDKISSIAWETTYNASCVAQAVGPSAAKLGIIPQKMTCKDWNDLSKDLGAKAGEPGSHPESVSSWYASKGYSCSRAWNGLFESEATEAKKALDRGCDVIFRYRSKDDKEGHQEMVTKIEVDANNSRKATVTTSSWGSKATVDYDSGEYSNKSDGNRYRAQPQKKSYLEGKGNGSFYYYCKK